MNKLEELEKAVLMHEEALESSKHSVIVDTQDLEQAKKDLANFSKPELTPSQLDDIYEAVEKGVDQFDFDDTDNFEIEYGISYDGKVECESHGFRNSQDLVEMIVDKVSRLFVEAECPEDEILDTTEADNHTVITGVPNGDTMSDTE